MLSKLKIIAVIFMGIFLTSCVTNVAPIVVPDLKIQKIKLVHSLLDCRGMRMSEFPDSDVLSDKQVAELLVLINSKLSECVNDVSAIKRIIIIHNNLIDELGLSEIPPIPIPVIKP